MSSRNLKKKRKKKKRKYVQNIDIAANAHTDLITESGRIAQFFIIF